MNAGDGPSDELMDARDDALATIFGPEDETRIVSPIPYFLGGDPIILTFSKHLPGTIYCTSEMTGGWGSGQRPGRSANMNSPSS